MSMDRIDLHTHSSHSDGSFTPRQLVRLARKEALRAIALTDHDTVAGVEEALTAGKELGVEVVPGVEISAQYPGGTMHILGYYLCTGNRELVSQLERLQRERAARNPKIIERLQTLGLDITKAEIQPFHSGQLGRPHIAQALVRKGYVSSIDQAFRRYLKKGGPGYVEKFRFSPQQAITMIRKAGGLAVLAHPSSLEIEEPTHLAQLVEDLQTNGLEGMEVYYPGHTDEMMVLYQKVAHRFGLLCTGGSDFHGTLRNGSYLGGGRGVENLCYGLLQDLKDRLRTSGRIREPLG
ncbi:MAG: PHP domain-containing protein [Deltaproteobacteria bacterium]|nr:MAG: PHP domain-containing protein [Deltaproteobacteria bacterium]